MSDSYDVVIVGGGLVGLSAALLLDAAVSQQLRIAIVEARPPALLSSDSLPDMSLRVSALSPASVCILESLGVWSSVVAQRVSPYSGMYVWHSSTSGSFDHALEFSAAELSVRELGFIVENDLLRKALWEQALAAPAIDIVPPASPESLSISEDGAELVLSDASVVSARLLVAADGANSDLRELLNVQVDGGAYSQRGIVANIIAEKPHQGIAYQRFLATGPVALLPLKDGRCSLVWSCADALADELLALDDTAFSIRLTEATEAVLGDLQCATPRVAFPLAYAHADSYSGLRFALVGDAAHRVHPLAGQGVNLGFLDAAALAETLASNMPAQYADPGDPLILRRYARWRRRDNELTLSMMNVLHRVFAGNPSAADGRLAKIGGQGLALVNAIEPAKRAFAEHALGRAGDLPKVAKRQ